MSQIRKTIDDADRTLTTLVGTERFIVRDSGGDAKVAASTLATLAGGRPIGELMPLERYEATSSTFPWKNLADADEELDEANYPDYVPVMRNIAVWREVGYYINESYAIDYSIISNVVTITLDNYPSHINLLNALSEMLLDYTDGASPTSTDYANWNMCLYTRIIAGAIPIGDYTITNINPSARQISFSYVTPNDSGSLIIPIRIYPYRVPGDSTKCRHRQQLGKSIMTPDFETFFNGVSWRDHLQGHWHERDSGGRQEYYLYSVAGGFGFATGTFSIGGPANGGGDPITDGTNGTPRTDSETYPSGLGAFLYRYVGRYVAP